MTPTRRRGAATLTAGGLCLLLAACGGGSSAAPLAGDLLHERGLLQPGDVRQPDELRHGSRERRSGQPVGD